MDTAQNLPTVFHNGSILKTFEGLSATIPEWGLAEKFFSSGEPSRQGRIVTHNSTFLPQKGGRERGRTFFLSLTPQE